MFVLIPSPVRVRKPCQGSENFSDCVLVVVFQRIMLISSSVEKNYQPLRWFLTSSFFFGYEKARFHTWDDRRRKNTWGGRVTGSWRILLEGIFFGKKRWKVLSLKFKVKSTTPLTLYDERDFAKACFPWRKHPSVALEGEHLMIWKKRLNLDFSFFYFLFLALSLWFHDAWFSIRDGRREFSGSAYHVLT